MDIDIKEVVDTRLRDHPANAVAFFKTMMLLEFALKKNGYARQDGNQLILDWGRYANEKLGRDFFTEISKCESAYEIINFPPNRQIINDGVLGWAEEDVVSDSYQLFKAIRCLRNNLFHGGKSDGVDQGRNKILIGQALFVIGAMLEYDEDLFASFIGNN